MNNRTGYPTTFDLEVTTHGLLPGAADYVRLKIGGLGRFARRPVLFARVKLARHGDPAVARPVVAQANLDVGGRLVRAQVQAGTVREAVDRLEARLRQRLEREVSHWDVRRGRTIPAGARDRRGGPVTVSRLPDAAEERRIVRRKTVTTDECSIDEAAHDMEMLDYDFHLFTEAGSGRDSVLYRGGETGYRLAQPTPAVPEDLAVFDLPVTFSADPAPVLTEAEAVDRFGLTGRPFLFFVDPGERRARVLYRRYDGDYGLIEPV